MGHTERSPCERAPSETFEERSQRHRCLVLLLGLIGFPLLLGFVGAYWLHGSGPGGAFVLGALVGAGIAVFIIDYWRSNR